MRKASDIQRGWNMHQPNDHFFEDHYNLAYREAHYGSDETSHKGWFYNGWINGYRVAYRDWKQKRGAFDTEIMYGPSAVRQSKLESFIEAKVNIAIGFFISWAVWWFVVGPLFGYETQVGSSLLITSIFTVTSLARSYFIRRFFNAELHKAVHAIVKRFVK